MGCHDRNVGLMWGDFVSVFTSSYMCFAQSRNDYKEDEMMMRYVTVVCGSQQKRETES